MATRMGTATMGILICTTAPERQPTTDPCMRFHDAATDSPVVSPTTTATATMAHAAGSSGNPSTVTTSAANDAATISRTNVLSH